LDISPPNPLPLPGELAAAPSLRTSRVLLDGIAKPIHPLGRILSPTAVAVSRRSEPPPASQSVLVMGVSHH
jgi:hypothetical protein